MSMGWITQVEIMPERPPLTNGLMAAHTGLSGFLSDAMATGWVLRRAAPGAATLLLLLRQGVGIIAGVRPVARGGLSAVRGWRRQRR